MQATGHSSENMPSNQKFGWLFAAIFAGAFAYFQWKHSLGLAIVSMALSILFALVTIFIPSALAPLNKAWFALSLFLGKVVSPCVGSRQERIIKISNEQNLILSKICCSQRDY